MFIISQTASYSWPVTVEVPVSGGKFEKQSFDAEFKRLPQSQIVELRDAEGTTDIAFAREVLVGWKGIHDANKQELPYSESARDMLLDIPTVATAVVMAFFASLSGSKAKN